MKKIFETWVMKQFGSQGLILLSGFDEVEGYSDHTVNAMWIGFNAGVELSNIAKKEKK